MQLFTFIGTSIPIFVLAFGILAIFYISLRLFPIDRLSDAVKTLVSSDAFHSYTGLVTIDGLLNAVNTLEQYKRRLGSLDSYLSKFQDVNYYRNSPCVTSRGCSPAEMAALASVKGSVEQRA